MHTLKFIFEFYGKKIKNIKKRDINYELNLDFPQNINYNESIFLLPKQVEEILIANSKFKEIINTKNNIFEYKDVLNSVLFYEGYFKIEDRDRKYYINKFKKLLNIKPRNFAYSY